ncbi:MAG: sulfatase-like hydrolase/transferase, partial [Kiritimatiellales bacterium]|nr:sulfatase-like hydrolase/transferase [Kiritimatiellales bacterium]
LNKNKPFCYMVSIPDPHGPDSVREPYASMYKDQEYTQPRSATKPNEGLPSWGKKQSDNYSQSKYYGMVKCIDDNVGKIVACLEKNGLMEKTIVIFTNDHGDLRGEHGRQNKGVPYEGSAKIAFCMRWPEKIKAGTIINESLGCTDFLPTILKLMEVPTAGKEEGRDASVLFTTGKAPTGWKDVTFFRGTGEPQAGWIAAASDRYKLILSPKDDPWLFDLKTDPDEMVNQFLNPEYREIVRDMGKELLAYGDKHNDGRVKLEKITAELKWCISGTGKFVSISPPPAAPKAGKKKKGGGRKKKK